MPYESLWDVWEQQADVGKKEIDRRAAREQMPLAHRDLLSTIEQRESSARYQDAATNRSETLLETDKAINEANAKIKTQEWVEMMQNPELRAAHEKASLTFETNQRGAWNEMYESNPEKYKSALMTEIEAKNYENKLTVLENQKKMKFNYLSEIQASYESGGAAAATETAKGLRAQWKNDFGTEMPYDAIDENSIGEINSSVRGMVYSLEHLRDMQKAQTTNYGLTAGERDRQRFLQLSQMSSRSEIDELEYKALHKKFLGNTFSDRKHVDDQGRVYTINQDTGEVVYKIDEATGEPIMDGPWVQRQTAEDRLVGAEDRRTFEDADESYKRFADEHRLFLDQMDNLNAMLSSPETADVSATNAGIKMAFIRLVKPTGTISSNYDIANVGKLQNLPQGVWSGVQSVWKGDNVSPKVKEEMLKYLSARYQQAKSREQFIIQRNQAQTRKHGVEWVPPVQSDLYAGKATPDVGNLSVEKINTMSLDEISSFGGNFDSLSDEQAQAVLNRMDELENGN